MTRDWDDLSAAIASASPSWVAVALLFGVAAMSTIGWNWLVLLRPERTRTVLRPGATWFFVGQLGKYVPGGIWPIVGQAELATRGGSTRSSAYSATALSMVATLLGAATFAVGAGLVSPFEHRWIAAGVGVVLLSTFIVLGAASVRRRTHDLVEMVTRRRFELPEVRMLGIQLARHVPTWLCFSAVNVCVHRSLGGSLEVGLVAELALATCVSWIAGFVVIGVPGGIGVREAVFVSLMTGPVGASSALSIAVVGRVVSIASDVVGAVGSVAFNGVRGERMRILRPGAAESSRVR
jgi:glycosyltransferase 2 family protein